MDDGAFEGVRVVELAQWVFVPVAGALLADWGADVIRIERPEGDPYRGLMTQGIGVDSGGVNMSIALASRGKRSIALDLRREEGMAVLHQLLETATPRRSPSGTRSSSTRGATATECEGPMRTTRGTTRRRSGRAVGSRTCSRPRTWTSRSASAAPWVTGTVRWRSRSGWRPRS